MKYTTMRYVAARRRSDGIPILVGTPDGDRWFTGGELRSDIRGEFHEQYDILKEYGEEVDNSGDMYDLFIQDYPPSPCEIAAFPKNLVVPLGWLSPEGKYFPCQDGEHINEAYDLSVAFYGSEYRFDRAGFLESQGWIHIGFGLASFDYDEAHITASQIKALNQMRDLGASEEQYVKGITSCLELAGAEPRKYGKLKAPKRYIR